MSEFLLAKTLEFLKKARQVPTSVIPPFFLHNTTQYLSIKQQITLFPVSKPPTIPLRSLSALLHSYWPQENIISNTLLVSLSSALSLKPGADLKLLAAPIWPGELFEVSTA